MKNSRRHPLIFIREKTKDNNKVGNVKELASSLENYMKNLDYFNEFCDVSYDKLKMATYTDSEMDQKESSYLRSKLKRRNPSIILRELNNSHDLLVEIKLQYEKLQSEVLKKYNEFLFQYENSKHINRKILKDFFKENPKFIVMTYITNEMIYEKIKPYLEGKFDNKKRSLRKIEFPLLRFSTKAIMKTSPLWYNNKVSVLSFNLKDFSYDIDKPLITPNFVFFQRVFEELIFQDINLPYISFELSKKINQSGEFLYIFRNDSDNYKIHRAKDVLVKVPLNPFFQKILKLDDKVVNLKLIQSKFNINSKEVTPLIRKMFTLGLLKLKNEFDEGFYALENLKQFICKLPYCEYNQKLSNYLDVLGNNIKAVNREFTIENLDAVYQAYDKICDFANLDRLEKKLMLYGDYIDTKPNNKYEYDEIKFSEHVEELLDIFPIFDINQMIKYEFIHQVRKVTNNDSIMINHPMLMKILTDVNLQYASYWTMPWKKIKTESTQNIKIQNIREIFIKWLYEQKGKEEIKIDEVVESIKVHIHEANLETEGYYTIFYHKEGSSTVINKIYPGYGSFYQRFLRYTDIKQKYGYEINEFYNADNWSYVEILETLGFNANVTNQSYFKERYRDRESRGDFYDTLFEYSYDEENAEIAFEDNELFIRYPDDNKIKPVIASSLIRALYPGRLAFISSLFTNISFIPDMSILFLNWSDQPIKFIPRITYKDIIIERKGALIKSSCFDEFNNSDDLEQYINIRRFLQQNIGEKFYFHCRKTKSADISSVATEFGKPQYCNINNILHYTLLLNSIKGVDDVLFREAIPEDYSASEYVQEVYINGRKNL